MRVCLVLSEFFAWGKYGGFGSMARTLGNGLKKRGVEVWVIAPRRRGQGERETIDGLTVLGYPGSSVLTTKAYALCDADVYHSQEATIATYAAMRAMPDRRHFVTCTDPFDKHDWRTEFRYDVQERWSRGLIYPFLWAYYGNPLVRRAVRRANRVYCQARFLIPKAQQLYRLEKEPTFLPNPYCVPKDRLEKAKEPTVCFLARWDPRKRPEIFFELAREFPTVKFLALGKAHDEDRNRRLRERYSHIPNLELVGFINPFESDRLNQILEKSWIMVNTAAREGLPAAFVEAAAHRCAILSCLDPDGFASRGGYHVKDDNFVHGLAYLIKDNRWQELGRQGYEYVLRVHDSDIAIQQHLDEYEQVLTSNPGSLAQ